jgi:hypothetical protein
MSLSGTWRERERERGARFYYFEVKIDMISGIKRVTELTKALLL